MSQTTHNIPSFQGAMPVAQQLPWLRALSLDSVTAFHLFWPFSDVLLTSRTRRGFPNLIERGLPAFPNVFQKSGPRANSGWILIILTQHWHRGLDGIRRPASWVEPQGLGRICKLSLSPIWCLYFLVRHPLWSGHFQTTSWEMHQRCAALATVIGDARPHAPIVGP